jgi:hypothetical protein
MISFKSDTKIRIKSTLPNFISKIFKKFFYYNDYVNFYGTELDITNSINYNLTELKNKLL